MCRCLSTKAAGEPNFGVHYTLRRPRAVLGVATTAPAERRGVPMKASSTTSGTDGPPAKPTGRAAGGKTSRAVPRGRGWKRSMAWLVRHRQTTGAATERPGPTESAPALYPTTQDKAGHVGQPPGGHRRRTAVFPEVPRACLPYRLDHRRPLRAYPQREDSTATGGSATHRGTPASPALGRATRGLLSVYCPGVRVDRGRCHTPLEQDRRVAMHSGKDPQLAPPIRSRSAAWLETQSPCTHTDQQPGCKSS